MANSIIGHTTKSLKSLRSDESWMKVQENVTKLCSELGIKRKEKRTRRKKRFFDEYGLDYHETASNTFQSLKIDVYYPMLDSLLMQIEERFEGGTLDVLKDMEIFTHENLLNDNWATRAEHFCKYYNLSVEIVENELVDFKQIYKVMEEDIDVSDTMMKINPSYKNKPDKTQGNIAGSSLSDDDYDLKSEGSEEEDDEPEDRKKNTMNLFILKGFIKPCRLLVQLSQYNELFALYKILITLAVTSWSAERAFSKKKINKNPIRCSMLDEWTSAMVILASETDILKGITNEEIINRFAEGSKAHSSILLQK